MLERSRRALEWLGVWPNPMQGNRVGGTADMTGNAVPPACAREQTGGGGRVFLFLPAKTALSGG